MLHNMRLLIGMIRKRVFFVVDDVLNLILMFSLSNLYISVRNIYISLRKASIINLYNQL